MGSPKLTSHKLKFLNPTFKEGVQITVRNGPKWSKRVVPDMTLTVAETNGDDVGVVAIRGALLTTFDALPNEILFREHDPTCRNYAGLLGEMRRVYPGFKETDVVTVLFFEFIE